MKLSNQIKNMELEFRKKLNEHLKNGDIVFDNPVDLDGTTFITKVLKCGLCDYLDEFGNEGQLETKGLNMYDLAIILDEIEDN